MPNELRIQNGLYLDNFSNNTGYSSILTFDTASGQVGYLSTSSITASIAATSIFPVRSETTPGAESNLWSTGPVSNLGAIPGSKRSIVLGHQAGNDGGTGNVTIGWQAGSSAGVGDNYNVSLGYLAGSGSFVYSNLIGYEAGRKISGQSSYSTYIGYKVASGSSLGNNNIIIGTNITLPLGRENSVNIGGVIFADVTHGNLTGTPFSGSVGGGKVGIGIPSPEATLHVSGTNLIVGTSTISGSLIISGSSRIIGTQTITGSLIVSSSSQIIGTQTITGSLIVSSSLTIVGNSASFVAPAPANVFHTNNNTLATTANAWRGAAAFFTPRKSGRVVAMCSGVHAGSSTATFTLYYSQSNAAPPAGRLTSVTGGGTQIGQSIQLENNSSTPNRAPFAISGMFDATIGQQYFVDMVQGGSSVTSSAFNLTVFEL